MSGNKGGRPFHSDWNTLQFEIVREGKKTSAKCKFCKKILKNTAIDRLKIHRNYCIPVDLSDEEIVEEMEVSVVDSNTLQEPYQVIATSSKTVTSNPGELMKNKSKISQRTLDKFVDKTTKVESTEIDKALGKYLFANNIPFRVVENKYFVKFIKMLRLSYTLPDRKYLSINILNAIVEESESQISNKINKWSVIIVDGWKNINSNMQTVAFVLQTSDGSRAFLNAYNFTAEEISESAVNLCQKLCEYVDLAMEKFDTEIYAVVSDNARNMTAMENISPLWHSTCSAHTANLLLKEIIDHKLMQSVVKIIKELRKTDIGNAIVREGGTRLKLPIEIRWCSYCETFIGYIKNLQPIKNVIANSKFGECITSDTISLVHNDRFKQQVEAQIKLMEPVCYLIKKCQNITFSIADSCQLWLELTLPEKFAVFLQKRKDMAISIFAKCANFLHHSYRGSLLSENDKEEIEVFLINEMEEKGLESFQEFKNNTGFFAILSEKSFSNPILFWQCAAAKHPELAKLALKMIAIPASSAEIERIFSTWKIIHSSLRNRLGFDKSKKLVTAYYNLNKNENNESECGDSDDDFYIQQNK